MRSSYVEALKHFVENGHVQEKLEPDYLICELKKKGIISQVEADTIMAKSSRLTRQKELFLDMISKQEDAAFETLLETMDIESYHWAREVLEKLVNKEIKMEEKRSEKEKE